MDSPSPTETKIPELPLATNELLNALGQVWNRVLIMLPNNEEQQIEISRIERSVAARDRFQNEVFGQFCQGLMKAPENMRDVVSGTQMIDWKKAKLPSPKKLISDAFKALGFRTNAAASGRGGYSLTKRSKNNIHLEVSFDLSPICGVIMGGFSIHSLTWGCHVRFQFPGCYSLENAPILDEGALHYAIDMSRRQSEFIEGTLVEELDQIFGILPAWWEFGWKRLKK